MKRKLSRSGSGWALFMPKTLLELIDVNPETDLLEVKVENDIVKITKAENEHTN
jgi:antitoxin component of MazEF toxin-antitoxin module